jgi:hypothetical protein
VLPQYEFDEATSRLAPKYCIQNGIHLGHTIHEMTTREWISLLRIDRSLYYRASFNSSKLKNIRRTLFLHAIETIIAGKLLIGQEHSAIYDGFFMMARTMALTLNLNRNL